MQTTEKDKCERCKPKGSRLYDCSCLWQCDSDSCLGIVLKGTRFSAYSGKHRLPDDRIEPEYEDTGPLSLNWTESESDTIRSADSAEQPGVGAL